MLAISLKQNKEGASWNFFFSQFLVNSKNEYRIFSQLKEPAYDQIIIGPPLPEKDYLNAQPKTCWNPANS